MLNEVGFLLGEGWVLDDDEAGGAAVPPVPLGEVMVDDASDPIYAPHLKAH